MSLLPNCQICGDFFGPDGECSCDHPSTVSQEYADQLVKEVNHLSECVNGECENCSLADIEDCLYPNK